MTRYGVNTAQGERERVGVVNSHDPLRFGNRYPLYQCIPQFTSSDRITEHLYNKNKATTVGLQAASLLSRGDELLVEDATHTGHELAEKESYLIMARGLIDANWGIIESPMYSMKEGCFTIACSWLFISQNNTRNRQGQETYRHRDMLSSIYN
ncbi:hypothetical protein QAD02_013411 [Eretmocerus hayati]|uniref:Uncharacterized protein n=1 Tax=Eretmocerus hayati TaxID=131215 RepID=A0ACC2P2S7_9HYME|nr:hypothetical protein QAD02_013411 [Eretmocerus hayati]